MCRVSQQVVLSQFGLFTPAVVSDWNAVFQVAISCERSTRLARVKEKIKAPTPKRRSIPKRTAQRMKSMSLHPSSLFVFSTWRRDPQAALQDKRKKQPNAQCQHEKRFTGEKAHDWHRVAPLDAKQRGSVFQCQATAAPFKLSVPQGRQSHKTFRV